jgi:hypothetical protein
MWMLFSAEIKRTPFLIFFQGFRMKASHIHGVTL